MGVILSMDVGSLFILAIVAVIVLFVLAVIVIGISLIPFALAVLWLLFVTGLGASGLLYWVGMEDGNVLFLMVLFLVGVNCFGIGFGLLNPD